MNRVTDISETLLISFYISGLKPNLQRELLVAKPATLGEVFALARVTEARLMDQQSGIVITTTATSITSQPKPATPRFSGPKTDLGKPPLLPTPTSVSSNIANKPLAIKWISPAERQERLNKGLCFNCDNKWARGHKCPGKFLLLMAEDGEGTGQDMEADATDAVESGDISILNSLIGHGSPRSLQLWGTIGSGEVHVLIDNGSTHNFVQPDIVERMCLPVQTTKAFKVYIGSGESLLCENMCSQVTLSMQGLIMEVDLYVLPMKGPDVVLGIQWLQKLGKVTHDYAKQTMEFTLVNTKMTWPVTRGQRSMQQTPEVRDPVFTQQLEPATLRDLTRLSDGIIVSILSLRVDYRALNAVTVKDKFPIPTADEMFDELGGAVIFTKLDLRAGYHQIRVHERDIYKTAFRTHDGHYEFLVMPFGLTNAPSTFQATMNRLFSPYLRKFVIVFFDDILVYSTTLTAHLEHLECVLNCLQEYQFYVKKSKCVFGAATLEYLGHIISRHGVEMDPKKVSAVREWPIPQSQRHVRGFLGLAGYYSRYNRRGYATCGRRD
ncbi:reverse transcriptase [Tanacetum coccineum]